MSNILAPFQLLELNVISAQDLAPAARSMRTYAVAWIHPDRKLSTRVDTQGHKNPTWNDKFVFRVDEEFLYADTSAIMIDIYALHWFKDIHVGSVRVLIGNLIPPPTRPFHQNTRPSLGMRFVALQVRRSSGRPQGILNVGVAVLDSSMRSMPLYAHNSSAVGYRHLMGEEDAYDHHNHMSPQLFGKPELRRTKSDTSSMITSDILARQQAREKKGKASSVLTPSEASSESKKKGRSKASSMLSGFSGSEVSKGKRKNGKVSSVLSDPGLQWKAKNENTSSIVNGSEVNELPIKGKMGKASPIVNDSKEVPEPPKSRGNVSDSKNQTPQKNITFDKPESLTSSSEATNDATDKEKIYAPVAAAAADERQRIAQRTNNVYEFRASPKPQFRNLPAPKHHQPMGYGGSNRGTPMQPVVGFGGSRKGTPRATPLHSFGKFNPALEYGTPRISNLGNMAAPVLTESELGPSPSEVAAAMAKYPKIDEGENSTVGGWSMDESVEGLQSKLERWRTELPPVYDRGELSSYPTSSNQTSHTRRHTDGGSGLFSCFSNICGCECSIVCGGGDARKKKGGRRRTPSVDNRNYV